VATLRDIVAYVGKNYPYKDELSNARVTKMIYLADWRSAITRGEQLTDLEWEFSHYGPYVRDVKQVAETDPALAVVPIKNPYGGQKDLIQVADGVDYPSVTEEEKELLDYVISSSASKNWDDFIKLVYSTYPIVTQDRFSKLDLVELAKEYEESIPLLDL
jgi:predicted nucleic acid-binding OB-fold protein